MVVSMAKLRCQSYDAEAVVNGGLLDGVGNTHLRPR